MPDTRSQPDPQPSEKEASDHEGNMGKLFGSRVEEELTGHKTAEKGEDWMKHLPDAVPQLIWTHDRSGHANYFNRRWYEYTGLRFEDLARTGWHQAIYPEDAPRVLSQWRRALKTGRQFESEYRLRNKRGGYRWFIGRDVPLHDDNGEAIGWLGSAMDVHALKQAEAARGESEERFRLLVEGTPDYAMFLLDPDNKISFWSTGAEKIFGWSAQEATGQSGELIFTPEDRAHGRVEKEMAIAMQEGRAPDRRWHLRKNGSRLWVDGVMRRLDDEQTGALRGFAKIARDATEQHNIEEELRHARDELEQRVLERTADLMATNQKLENSIVEREELERELLEISERERRRIGQDLHDIVCQELTATALFLKSTANKIDNRDAAKMLSEAAEIVNRNVAAARDLARGFQPGDLRAGGLLEGLRGLCKQVNDEQRQIHCTLKLPKDIRIRDEALALNLFRIAQEAVRNAVSHSGGDEIVICMEREKAFVRLVVEDNGKGFTARKGRNRSKGLGMHIMRYRANALGGTLMIDRRPKSGTKVTCEIPVKAKARSRKKK